MECDICARGFDARRQPVCVSCAQAVLYGSRIEQAKALLRREETHTHAEAILRPGNDGVLAALPQDADWDAITAGVSKYSVDRLRAAHAAVESRILLCAEQAERLRQQIQEHKTYLEKGRRANARRREEILAERAEFLKRQTKVLEPVQLAIRKAGLRLDKVYNRTVSAKAYLCYNAGVLSGLSQELDSRGRPTGRYSLVGIRILDLRELNENVGRSSSQSSDVDVEALSADHTQRINALLDHVCRLVEIWSHYLSIRLPAEIIAPHNDFPHSAILPEKSSYRTRDLPYPGTLLSQNSSPSASRLLPEQRNQPRPRLLHLDRPLSKLLKDDQKKFGLFVEGVMLLAWDIAWLCRSQGLTTVNTFDDVCNIGKNLWLLHRSQETSVSSRPSINRRISTATDVTTRSNKSTAPPSALQFGSMTHGSIRHSLAGHEGATLMDEWRLILPHRLIDKLRTFLITEATGAEWDVLSDGDFDDERDDEVAVLVGGSQKKSTDSRHPAMSVMTVAAPDEINQKVGGSSGWMKVRGRNDGT